MAKLGPTWARWLLTILASENNKLEIKVSVEHQDFRVIGGVALEYRINALGRYQFMHFLVLCFLHRAVYALPSPIYLALIFLPFNPLAVITCVSPGNISIAWSLHLTSSPVLSSKSRITPLMGFSQDRVTSSPLTLIDSLGSGKLRYFHGSGQLEYRARTSSLLSVSRSRA